MNRPVYVRLGTAFDRFSPTLQLLELTPTGRRRLAIVNDVPTGLELMAGFHADGSAP